MTAETNLIGAMLLTPEAIKTALDVGVGLQDFNSGLAGRVFLCAIALHELGEQVDPISVAKALELSREDRTALLKMQAGTPASFEARRYAEAVHCH